jgi:hypothetical protein
MPGVQGALTNNGQPNQNLENIPAIWANRQHRKTRHYGYNPCSAILLMPVPCKDSFHVNQDIPRVLAAPKELNSEMPG